MYKNKIMLITGCNRGIGRAITSYFKNLGMKVIVTYHNNIIDDEDSYYLDLKDENCIRKLKDEIKNKYGKIDYLINNAALSLDNDIYEKSHDEFMSVLETNVVGTFLMMKYFDEIVDGIIFNISSTDGIDTGSIYSIDYNASKAGVNSITKTFSMISSNKIIGICPNWVDTESTKEMDNNYLDSELKRIGQDKLINVDTIPKVIDDCIKNNVLTGTIIRIEGDDNVRGIS